MSEDKDPEVVNTNKGKGNLIQDVWVYVRLIVRLMADPRVSPLIKFITVAALAYMIYPFDLPFILDDAAVLGLGMFAFIELCPKDVVDEHVRELNATIPGQWKNPFTYKPPSKPQDDVIDAEFRDKEP